MKNFNKRATISESDTIMLNCMRHLVSDLAASISMRGVHLERIHCALTKAQRNGDVSELRLALDDLPIAYNLDPYVFKVIYQIKSYLKRYIFSKDIYSPQDLKRMTFEKFLEVQEHIGRRHEFKYTTKLVAQRARRIVRQVLGPLDKDEWLSSGRLSTRACVGYPTPKSYLHDKIAGLTTGSFSHQEYVFNYFSNDYSDVGMLFTQRFCAYEYMVTDTLDFRQVPKSFKINRGMMPNTLAGSLQSSGLADMIARRLKRRIRIDLSRQPQYHKVLAKRNSVTRKLVTTDLTSASDCYTSEVVNMLVPRDWFRALNAGRAKYTRFDGTIYSLQSFMAMGIGFTFPLQTLLYYAIIKAIQELHGSAGTISVFGDDLIYPKCIHRFVVSVLTDLKFRINDEKTFVNENFRESCGGDFYHGIDVRPCSPEGVSRGLGKWEKLSLLHKLANGLTARWTEHEIPSTLLYLQKEAAAIAPLMCVPEDFPDYSGFKRCSVNQYLLCQKHVWSHKLFTCVFPCLLEVPKKKVVPSLIGYYWDKLRQKHQETLYGVEPHPVITGIFPRTMPRDLYSTVIESISWIKDKTQQRSLGIKPTYRRTRLTKQRQLIWWPTVPDKQAKTIMKVHMAISILAS